MKKVFRKLFTLFHKIYAYLNREVQLSEPPSLRGEKRVLAIQANAIGDFLMTIPALASLHKRYPDHALDIVIQPANAPLLPFIPVPIDNVYLFTDHSLSSVKRTTARIREQSRTYSIVVDFSTLLYSAYLSRHLVKSGIAKISAGFSDTFIKSVPSELPSPGKLYSFVVAPLVSPIEPLNIIMSNFSNLVEQLGCARTGFIPLLAPNNQRLVAENILKTLVDDPEKPYPLLLHPGGKWPPKRWPLDNWFDLVGRILDENRWTPILVLGPGEKSLLPIFRDNFPSLTIYTPDSIAEFAKLVMFSVAVVSLDSAAMHLARGFQKPYVALFGPVEPRQSGYPGYSAGIHLWANLECSPCELYYSRDTCKRGHNYCMDCITPEEVSAALDTLLSDTSSCPGP